MRRPQPIPRRDVDVTEIVAVPSAAAVEQGHAVADAIEEAVLEHAEGEAGPSVHLLDVALLTPVQPVEHERAADRRDGGEEDRERDLSWAERAGRHR